jgi:hypothetical protein
MPSPLAQALYLTRQHYRRTVPSRVDNNRIISSMINPNSNYYYILKNKNKKYHTVGTILNSNRKIIERGKIDTSST